jgi:hypothetical protein
MSRKPDPLRKRHLARAHRNVDRPHNPAVRESRLRSLTSASARTSSRWVRVWQPRVGLLALLAAPLAALAGSAAWTWLSIGCAAGALLGRRATRLFCSAESGDPPHTATAASAVSCFGAGLAPGLAHLSLPLGLAIGGFAAALGCGGIALARGAAQAAWVLRLASGVALVTGSWLFFSGVSQLVIHTTARLVPALADLGGAAALTLAGLVPLSLLHESALDDPSAELES